MKENSIEETIKQLKLMLKVRKEQKEIIECAGGSCINCDPDIKALSESIDILSDYKRVLKENEELKKSKITYEAVRDIQEKNRNIVDNNYISKQIVKDNLIKYQEEYELLLEHQSGKESNKTKTLRGRIHMCQELLEGRK